MFVCWKFTSDIHGWIVGAFMMLQSGLKVLLFIETQSNLLRGDDGKIFK
tara:strand:- start:300 stop:446 length:147 start_codon:yes stop_codon:yes gene_type:complete